MTEQSAPETTPEAVEGEAQEAAARNSEDSHEEAQEVAEESAGATEDGAVEREREARRKANREAQNLRERLRKYEEAEEQRKQEAMSELERATARAEKVERERNEAIEIANSARDELRALRVRQTASSRALSAGTRPDRVDAVLGLTDLTGATDEDGNPDPKAVEAAVKATLKAYPEFKQGSPNIGGPTNPPADAPNGSQSVANMSDEEIAKLSQRVQWGERVTFP